jgi:HEAT repeat protein
MALNKGSFKLELRTPKLRAWLEHGMAQLVVRVREAAGGQWGEEVQKLSADVQRFGNQAWQRIALRWPALAELVKDRTPLRARYRPAAPSAPEPPLSVEAIDALLAQLTASPSWQARSSAALSLGHVEAEGVVPTLVSALRDISIEVSVSVVDALSSHHELEATTALLDVLKNPEGYFSPITRVAALSGLARRLSIDELGPVFAAVRDIDAEVSIAAISVIAERVPALAREHLLPILRDAGGYFLPLVRLAAANALERSGSLTEPLASELLQSESDASVRRVLDRAKYLMAQGPSVLT